MNKHFLRKKKQVHRPSAVRFQFSFLINHHCLPSGDSDSHWSSLICYQLKTFSIVLQSSVRTINTQQMKRSEQEKYRKKMSALTAMHRLTRAERLGGHQWSVFKRSHHGVLPAVAWILFCDNRGHALASAVTDGYVHAPRQRTHQ